MSAAIALTSRSVVRWMTLSLSLILAVNAWAGEFRLSLPKRSKPTPVQKLNQDGVKACQKHDYDRAKKLFYKAYLIDPNDPFTLNNLGYIAELEGDLERAQRYYTLAAENPSDALVYRASDKRAEGKPVSQVAGNAQDRDLMVNRYNIQAMSLLMKDRAPEADVTLMKAMALDPRNPFTLNNLGYAKEKEGEIEQAVRFYQAAADVHSEEPVVVTVKKDWRGKAISSVASENAKAARRSLERVEDIEAKIARYNLRGVSALNRNDRVLARQYFQQAYKLDPNNAFTLNNMGYVAELDGDRETADWFYEKSKEGDRSGRRVAVATRRDAEGLPVAAVAATNDQTVTEAQQADVEARRRQGVQPALRRRDNTVVQEEGAAPLRKAPRRADPSEVQIPAEPGAVATPSQPDRTDNAPQNETTSQPQTESQQTTTPAQPTSVPQQQTTTPALNAPATSSPQTAAPQQQTAPQTQPPPPQSNQQQNPR